MEDIIYFFSVCIVVFGGMVLIFIWFIDIDHGNISGIILAVIFVLTFLWMFICYEILNFQWIFIIPYIPIWPIMIALMLKEAKENKDWNESHVTEEDFEKNSRYDTQQDRVSK